MMKKGPAVLFCLGVVAGSLFAEPYIAVREGLKCSACHENRTGGGKRTPMGAAYGVEMLPWIKIDLQREGIPEYWSVLNDHLSVGGNFRAAEQSTFLKDKASSTFEMQKSNLYLMFDLLPDHLSAYVDESVAPGGAQTREFFALVRDLPAGGWIKAGKLIQPYGLRLEDDRAFIRQVTGFNFNNPDLGAEFGMETDRWSAEVAVTNGTAGSLDDNVSKQVVGSLSYVASPLRIGLSGSWNKGDRGSKNSAAAWGGFRVGRAVFLGEVNTIRDDTFIPNGRHQFVGYAEADWLIVRGWNAKVAYEYYDPNTRVAQDHRDRVLLGIEPFLTPFLQAGIFYRFNQSIPQNRPQNADELMVRLHVYF